MKIGNKGKRGSEELKLPATELVSKHKAADQRERERERAVMLINDKG